MSDYCTSPSLACVGIARSRWHRLRQLTARCARTRQLLGFKVTCVRAVAAQLPHLQQASSVPVEQWHSQVSYFSTCPVTMLMQAQGEL